MEKQIQTIITKREKQPPKVEHIVTITVDLKDDIEDALTAIMKEIAD